MIALATSNYLISNDASKPGRLERRLSTNHKALKEKPKEFFTVKLHELNRMKLDSSSVFHQETGKLVEASYELSLLIAKAKKPHSVGETLVKPCLLSAANTVLGEESQRKLSKISLSDNRVKRRIDELSDDMKEQVLYKIKASRFLAIQCDESTDVAHLCQLFVYSRFVDEGTVKEEILFLAALETTAKDIDVISKVDEFFQEHGLSWKKLVGVCTDGAPSMIGSRSGFVKLVKEKNPAVTETHCVIHIQSLANKTLPGNLRSSLNLAIKVVNFVKNSSLNARLFAALCSDLGTDYKTLLFHTEVRWLYKGNMLSRFYELKDKVEIFLQKQKQDKLYEAFREENFQLSLAYLVDFFEAINNLNLKLQGRNTNIIAHSDVIRAFTEKIHLWKRKVRVGNFSSFSHLNELLSEKRNIKQYDVTKEVLSHLHSLAEEFMHYFPDVSMENSLWTVVQNPFNTDVELLLESLQEEAIDLKCDSSAKRDFETMKLEEFWVKYLPTYPKVGEEALRVILPFSSTYLCEAGFSALVVRNTKQCNRLDVENDLRCALSSLNPRISDLLRKKQQHPSH
ncbi:protein of unknown function DUF4371 [Trinorchestia longiramus]|nr:protein of unknown function DUF4371 [Trinorchestia longiramus]